MTAAEVQKNGRDIASESLTDFLKGVLRKDYDLDKIKEEDLYSKHDLLNTCQDQTDVS